MMFIIQFLLGTALLLVVLYPFFALYNFIRDSIRMVLYKMGHRVFTIPELQERGLTARVEDGVVEGVVVIKKSDKSFSKTYDVEATVVDERELEERRKKKEKREFEKELEKELEELEKETNYFEDPIKKFKNFDF